MSNTTENKEGKYFYYDALLNAVNRGKKGLNIGLPHGKTSLVDYVPNVQQSTYYLLGGETGSGKTSLADDMFIYNPYEYVINKEANKLGLDMVVLYFSLEIDLISKVTKGVCRKIFNDTKLITDVNYILSRGKNRISQEVYDLVLHNREYFNEFEDKVKIYDRPINPTGIQVAVKEYCRPLFTEHKEGNRTVYKPKNPNLYIMVVVDHVALTKNEQGFKSKENIDHLSKCLVDLRNSYGVIPIMISQFNRQLAGVERQLSLKDGADFNKVKPQLNDFKDTGNTQQDANVVLSIFSPNRYDVPEYLGYNIRKLKDRFRALSVLKCRDGQPDLIKGLAYVGEIGYFQELPIVVPDELYKNLEELRKVTTSEEELKQWQQEIEQELMNNKKGNQTKLNI